MKGDLTMAFKPPAASERQLDGIDFSTAVDFATSAKKRYDTFDKTGTKDPNKCKALLKFPNDAAVFWSSKMAIDTDGPSAGKGRPTGKQLDPNPGNATDETSFRFAGGSSLPSEIVPYIVLPQSGPKSGKPFDPLVDLGDLAVVIFGDRSVAAICGDFGPHKKIGEGSIRVHEVLQPGVPDPCAKRSPKGFCLKTRDASVDENVLFFIFPNSKFAKGELTLSNINTMVKERAFGLYNKLRGST
jgi:hypothetical protein